MFGFKEYLGNIRKKIEYKYLSYQKKTSDTNLRILDPDYTALLEEWYAQIDDNPYLSNEQKILQKQKYTYLIRQ